MRGRIFQHSLAGAALTWALAGQTLAAPPNAKKERAEKAETAPSAPEAPTRAPPAAERGPDGAAREGAASVVKTEEGKEGVKTYQFGAVEVEGRLRSPQLIYFLRRVRAEFVAGDLGHRSFLRELESTRRSGALR